MAFLRLECSTKNPGPLHSATLIGQQIPPHFIMYIYIFSGACATMKKETDTPPKHL